MDRRIQKTREAIMSAFVALLEEKGFEQITLNEIAQQANVNRGTIYLHYLDKYDLLDKCIETYLNLHDCMPQNLSRLSIRKSLLNTFQHLENNAFIYTVLMKSKGIPTFRSRLLTGVHKGLALQLEMNGPNTHMKKTIMVQFLVSAIAGLVEWWILEGRPYPPEEMVEHVMELLERQHVLV
ncbi:TetR/AcrR family transcriptional regulator [Paenibacillus sp. NEAU-GSW1]|uniref:TetR/AcrR family transcriptional regulator n=1 Tax=Paenibacillus sp. NEAU-GSW1 TaxID=2682486 RepID=UPI0012E32CAA|nr:TetR/AcrR family transcriptional regulator [Paenibacillus sp. NEAU-GSW1]MUT64833.1 TetR family transcriptional regulator [Paenibacillus sp. NEAU-GSW1]